MINVKVKRIAKDAILPSYAHVGDAGMDLYSIEDVVLEPGEFVSIRTGLVFELPEGFEAQIRPRSGLALKHGVTVLNAPGTIDSGYRGEICVILINHSKKPFEVKKGMRIAQIVIQKVLSVRLVECEEISDSTRGDKGFGSTGI